MKTRMLILVSMALAALVMSVPASAQTVTCSASGDVTRQSPWTAIVCDVNAVAIWSVSADQSNSSLLQIEYVPDGSHYYLTIASNTLGQVCDAQTPTNCLQVQQGTVTSTVVPVSITGTV